MKIKHFFSFLLLLILQFSFLNCNACVFENKEAVVNNIEVSGFEKSGFTENNIFEASFLKAVSCRSVSFRNGYAKLVESWKISKGTDLATDVSALGKISNYIESGVDINVFKADMVDVLSTGNQALKKQWLNTLGDDNYILLRRGTDRYSDISAFDQSGYMLSDAARTKYIESGGILEEALNFADEVHQQWLDIFDGDIYKYAEEHSLRGNFEMEEVYGLKRTLVSFTSDRSTIDNFIPDGGEVFIGLFEKSKVVKQTLNTSNESEYLIICGAEIFNIVP